MDIDVSLNEVYYGIGIEICEGIALSTKERRSDGKASKSLFDVGKWLNWIDDLHRFIAEHRSHADSAIENDIWSTLLSKNISGRQLIAPSRTSAQFHGMIIFRSRR
jgi:hypothetical protein